MQQLDIFGKTKEETAIEFLQIHEPKEGYFLGFSGGKDSLVMKYLTELAGVKFTSYYSATGIDPPELLKYIKRYHPEVIWLKPELNFYAGIIKKQLPTKWRRWCCDELKEKPGKKINLKNRLLGLRAEESYKRRKYPQIEFNSRLKQWVYKPIVYWQAWEIWDFIDRHKLPYCSLYDEGFDRIGCVICPFLCYKNSRLLKIHQKRWPKMYAAFERCVKKYWENKGHKFKENNWKEFLTNWYEAKPL